MYPSTIASLTNPQATDRLNSPAHSTLHQSENTEITAIETFVGTLSSTQGSLMYDIRAAASDGGGHVQGVNKGGTGFTSYTKGDVLIAQSSSVLVKLAAGLVGQALVVDPSASSGVKWGVPNNNPTIRFYSTPSTLTWNKPSTLSYIVVEAVGAGAGTQGFSNNGTGAGGGGGYSKKVIPASLLAISETVKIGSGGLVGSVGGISSFGTTSFMSASSGATGSNPTGGAGGAAAGDIAITGQAGGTAKGVGGSLPYTLGGNSPLGFGYGGASSVIGGTSQNGSGYGGGGGADPTGGTGAGGVVIVYEY